MKSERQFRLLSLILLGICGLIFVRQMSRTPSHADTNAVSLGVAVAAPGGAFGNEAPASFTQEEVQIIPTTASTDLEVQSVIEVENINSGKLPTFNAGIDSEK